MRTLFILIFIGLFSFVLFGELYIRLFCNYCEPWFDKSKKILKRKPDTEGIYRTEFTNTGYYRINNKGWNSHQEYYERQDTKDREQKFRIAIVGHSNIEGLRVPVDKTMSKILEDDLNKNGIPTEVYTFGFGGMHLVQAMHVSRYIANQLHPNVLIIGTMLDDCWAQ